MTKKRQFISGFSFWLAVLFAGFMISPLLAEFQEINYRFILKPIEISPTAMLDAEQLVRQAKKCEAVSDSLWQCIVAKPDSEMSLIVVDELVRKKAEEGLELLSSDLDKLTRVRQIQRNFNDLKPEDLQYLVHELYQMAIRNIFDVKTKNPYQPYAKISTFQQYLNTLISRKVSFVEVSEFIETVKATAWLEREKNELYILTGTAFQYFNEWESAFECYKMAYDVVKETVFPPGVDSSFSIKIDSIANKTFIAPERKLMADMLLKQAAEIKAINDSLRIFHEYFADSTNYDLFSFSDSITTRKLLDQAVEIIQVEDRMARKKFRKLKSRISSFHIDDLEFAIDQVFLLLEKRMLEAKEINPFDQNLRLFLGREIYYKTAEQYKDSTLFAKSAQELENLIWIMKGNFVYFLFLGDAYMGMKEFQKAFDNYKISEETLVNWSILASDDPAKYAALPDSVPLDKELLSHCYSRQADAKIKLYEGKEALVLLHQALELTANPDRQTTLKTLIDLVNWDDGNVLAMNLRKKANDFLKVGDYKSARGVLIKLLEILWTQRTKDEINNQVAMVDFQHLDRRDEGVERMRFVVSPMKKDVEGAAVESVNQAYFQNYGRMCYDLGIRYLGQEEDRKIAYIYLFQSTKMKWSGRPKAYLQLAALSEFDPREAIRLGFLALEESTNLTPGEKRLVAELLSNAFQKEAKFKEARSWYRLSLDKAWCENQDQS